VQDTVGKQADEVYTEKNGLHVTATKVGTTNKYFVAAAKNFAAATKRFVDRTKHCVFVTKYFCYPILTNDFVGKTKPFIPCINSGAIEKREIDHHGNSKKNVIVLQLFRAQA